MSVQAIQSGWAGRVVDGKFTLLKWLGGAGGSGVFLTELPGDPAQKAAIKLMPSEAYPVVATSGILSHPHLIRVFASGRCEIDGISLAYAVTEYADEVLAEILPMRPLTPGEVKEMLAPVVDALACIHDQGLVHGHLKPSNILAVNDQLKLSADSLQPASHTVGVTHALSVYDAPERADGVLSPASDVWSLGVTIVEALTQRPPDWNRAANSDPQIPDSMPQPFAEVAASCLRVDPSRRGTLNDVKRRLGMAVASPVAASATEASETPKQQASFRLRPGMLTVAVLVIIAVIALLWSRSHQPQPEPQSSEPAKASQSTAAPVPAQPEPQPQPQVQAPAKASPEQQEPTAAPPPPAPKPAPVVPAESVPASGSAVARRVMPDVLPSASESIQGRVNVSIRVNVDAAGNVSDAGFESAGPSKYFAKAAMEAARQWKFTPPEANGQPMASAWTLHFVFTRGNTDVTAEQAAH